MWCLQRYVRLTTTRTQIVQFGATDAATTYYGDRVDVGRVQREYTLHAFTEGNLANGERTGNASAVFTADANAFVVLHTGARTLGHLKAYANGIAGFEIGDVFPQGGNLFRLELCDQVHLIISYLLAVVPQSWCRPRAPRLHRVRHAPAGV